MNENMVRIQEIYDNPKVLRPRFKIKKFIPGFRISDIAYFHRFYHFEVKSSSEDATNYERKWIWSSQIDDCRRIS